MSYFSGSLAAFAVALGMFVGGNQTQAACIKIEKIVCEDQQEISGDELLVRIWVDGKLADQFSQRMRNGDSLRIDKDYTYSNSVRVELLEEDKFSADLLGSTDVQTPGEHRVFGGQPSRRYDYRVKSK